ncbi:M14 family metallopeptidase [Salibacterium qingdaonense]|uniref:Gamma-D-glutamyl-(L)-meso-diaminopimelate peptidase I Metallo peptidase. MEROPS family M14C n=1 Tax=Salibacterium qingdaonense TaxID=266892 RepID=A0A1I4M5W7_9BACI|nr:M14 family metallopeptidase [Salibacterium qingdaonense]SFL98652.1 gamma-D-glutamyl-{L}-meso-diaminopimelate peptidase I Metallo peptidase. MEROPS family M14C [Salibacterium qingdaonense]
MIKYNVKQGDTVRKIAVRFQVSTEQLLSRNNMSLETYLEPGTTILVPKTEQTNHPLRETQTGCVYEYGWRELEEDRKSLPSSIYSEQIGTSVLGKPIWLFRAGSGPKKILFSAAWHGNEWLNTWLLMSFLHMFISKEESKEHWYDVNPETILQEVTLYVVPLVNPDGVELVQEGAAVLDKEKKDEVMKINGGMNDFRHWSANARGVDLNHQWPAGWKEEAAGSPDCPFPRHYGGEAPLTEPEAKAVYQLSMQEEFSHVLALHSQGEEVYWGYSGLEPPESAELGRRLAAAGSFRPVEDAGSSAGYKDWFIKTFRRPGFTIETGVGMNPLPPEASARIWVTGVPLLLESLTFTNFTK